MNGTDNLINLNGYRDNLAFYDTVFIENGLITMYSSMEFQKPNYKPVEIEIEIPEQIINFNIPEDEPVVNISIKPPVKPQHQKRL